MRAGLVALLLAAAGVSGAQARDALSVLDSCLAKLDRAVDSDYARIVARCPDLEPGLSQSEWAPWLPRDWNRSGPDNKLSVDGLAELRTLLVRAAATAAVERAPRVAQVAPLLARLTEADAPRGGWWARFKQWLREVLQPAPEHADRGWLRRLLGDLGESQAVIDAIGWGSLAVVVALAFAVVLNELRVAGLLRRRRGGPGRALARSARPQDLTLRDLDQAAPAQQPQLLLELVTARLGEQERLPPARALTLQELLHAARLPQESDREHLRTLTSVCERLRFSGNEVAPPLLAAALTHGRELLAGLQTSAAQGVG